MTVRHFPLQPLGVAIPGLPLSEIDPQRVVELEILLARHGFALFTGQTLSDGEFVIFLKRFGELTFAVGEAPLPGFPDLNVVSNVGRKTKPRSVFHIDTSYVQEPPRYTALRAVQIPAEGGETLFTDQYRAYETLPGKLRDRLQGRTVTHVVTGLTLDDDEEKAADHPIFRRHPISGRTALYLSTPERCVAISGVPDEEAKELIRQLYEHSTTPQNTYRHLWSARDIVMWDNGCVMHRADHAMVAGDRVLHRGLVGSSHEAGRA